jgi:hypothetical protein
MSHEVWDAISPDAKDLVKRMLHPNPFQRITAAQILEHPWLQEETDEVRACCFGGCACCVCLCCVGMTACMGVCGVRNPVCSLYVRGGRVVITLYRIEAPWSCAAVVAAAVDGIFLQCSTAASRCNSSRLARPYFTTFFCLYLFLPTGGRADADVQRPHAFLRGQGGLGQPSAAAGQVQLQERLHQALRYVTLLRVLLCYVAC